MMGARCNGSNMSVGGSVGVGWQMTGFRGGGDVVVQHSSTQEGARRLLFRFPSLARKGYNKQGTEKCRRRGKRQGSGAPSWPPRIGPLEWGRAHRGPVELQSNVPIGSVPQGNGTVVEATGQNPNCNSLFMRGMGAPALVASQGPPLECPGALRVADRAAALSLWTREAHGGGDNIVLQACGLVTMPSRLLDTRGSALRLVPTSAAA
mmetsp:Transcript_10291/g.34036  ORF Transcript_10291/g.34036 Transcript_10291/m.34036 type:complete len:207 (-) Transcript_10291:1166-1786(-)